MKKILSSLLMLVAFTAFAQTPASKPQTGRQQKTPEERATAFATHLEKSLALTPEQKTKVHDLVLARDQKIGQLREENKGKDRCAWSDQRKKAQDDFIAGMKSTLTPDQFAKWEAQKAEHQKQREAKRPQSTKTPEERATGFTTHLEKQLTLTPEQKTKVNELVLTREKANDQLREKYKGQDPCASSAERKQVRENFDNGMKATLTPEQYKKWEEQKKQRMEERKNKKHQYQKPQGK
jgi:Spy/CpxP family protein refolding chaperone